MGNLKTSTNLSSKQSDSFESLCLLLNISTSDLMDNVTVDNNTVAYLAANSKYPSIIQHKAIEIKNLQKLLAFVGVKNDINDSKLTGKLKIPPPWLKEKSVNDINGHDMEHLEQALKLILSGYNQVVESYLEPVEKYFFPLTSLVFAAKKVIVKSGSKLVIKGNNHNPVIINYGKLTIEEGGQIICETNVLMNVQNLIKSKKS